MASKNITIELSKQNAQIVESNAVYAVSFPQPVLLNDGTQISLKYGFIDTGKSDTNSYIFPNDIAVQALISYYDVDFSAGNKVSGISKGPRPDASLTFDYYSAYSQYEIDNITDSIWRCKDYVPITDGRFGKEGTQILFSNLVYTYIDEDGNQQDTDPISSNGPKGEKSTDTVTIPINPPGGINYVRGTFNIKSLTITKREWKNGISKDVPSTIDRVINTKNTITPVGTSSDRQLDLRQIVFTIPAGQYDRETLATILTNGFNNSQGVAPVNPLGQFMVPASNALLRADEFQNDVVFRRIQDFSFSDVSADFTDDNTYVYFDGANTPAVFYGASNIELSYGTNGQVFQFNYLHTPLEDPADPTKETIGYFLRGVAADQRVYQVKQATGVIIHDLQPREFWDDLGIYDKIVSPLQTDICGVKIVDPQNFTDKIIGGFPGNATFLKGFNRYAVDPTAAVPQYRDITGETEPIIGTPLQVYRNGGWFLLELTGLPGMGGYLDPDNKRNNIFAIVPNQFNEDNITTAYGDSGLAYIYRGKPTTVQQIGVRILDPITKRPIETLQDDTCIYIQVTDPQLDALQAQMNENSPPGPVQNTER